MDREELTDLPPPAEFAKELVEEARARMRASREAREDAYFAAVRAASSALALGGSLDAFDRAVEDAEVAFCRGVVEDLTRIVVRGLVNRAIAKDLRV